MSWFLQYYIFIAPNPPEFVTSSFLRFFPLCDGDISNPTRCANGFPKLPLALISSISPTPTTSPCRTRNISAGTGSLTRTSAADKGETTERGSADGPKGPGSCHSAETIAPLRDGGTNHQDQNNKTWEACGSMLVAKGPLGIGACGKMGSECGKGTGVTSTSWDGRHMGGLKPWCSGHRPGT